MFGYRFGWVNWELGNKYQITFYLEKVPNLNNLIVKYFFCGKIISLLEYTRFIVVQVVNVATQLNVCSGYKVRFVKKEDKR